MAKPSQIKHLPLAKITILQTRQTVEEHLADSITDFYGRSYFVYFHTVWFGI